MAAIGKGGEQIFDCGYYGALHYTRFLSVNYGAFSLVILMTTTCQATNDSQTQGRQTYICTMGPRNRISTDQSLVKINTYDFAEGYEICDY